MKIWRFRAGGDFPSASYRNHDGSFFLTLTWFIDFQAFSAANVLKDVQKIDPEDGVKENLGIALRHSEALHPSIDNDKIFDFDRE